MKALRPLLLYGGLLGALIVGFTLVSTERSEGDLRASVRTDDVGATRDAVVEKITELGGTQVGETTDNSTPSSTLRFRVPVAEANAALTALGKVEGAEVAEKSLDLEVIVDEEDDERVDRLRTLDECLAEAQGLLVAGSGDEAERQLSECQTIVADVAEETDRAATLTGDVVLVVDISARSSTSKRILLLVVLVVAGVGFLSFRSASARDDFGFTFSTNDERGDTSSSSPPTPPPT